MDINLMKYSLICSFVLLSGCVSHNDSVDTKTSMDAAPNTRYVLVSIRNPSQYTEPTPISATYTSNTCNTDVGFNYINFIPQKNKNDSWSAKIPMTGTNNCTWNLNNINLGIEYTDVKHLAKPIDTTLRPGSSTIVSISFVKGASKLSDFNKVIHDNITIAPKCYPEILTRIHPSQETLNVLSEQTNLLDLKKDGDIGIIYAPKLDEKQLVRTISATVDDKTEFVYPDGRKIVSVKNTFPDLKLLK